MAKKNYYAVKVGRKPGIYQTWSDAEEQIKGFQNALYKGFSTLSEAETYMQSNYSVGDNSVNDVDSLNAKIKEEIEGIEDYQAIAFVDGSYDSKNEIAGFGVIVFTKEIGKESFYRSFKAEYKPEVAQERNIFAEIQGAQDAISYAIKLGKNEIKIYYDYQGIGAWATGEWKAKSTCATEYVKFINKAKLQIKLLFQKISAHTGIEFNEEADKLAKNSLLAEGFKSYQDGSVVFIGYSVEKWYSLIDKINSENLETEQKHPITIEIKSQSDKKTILLVCDYDSNSLTVSCYRGGKSYVQGRQTVLFQRVLSFAIDELPSSGAVVETLNRYHALNITEEETETQFRNFVPGFDYAEDRTIYQVLLSAAYNTLFSGYMPDYTCLVTPIFRAFEYYLHKTLDTIPGVNTSTNNGTNNFRYFDTKATSNKLPLKAEYQGKLKSKAENYIVDLYDYYRRVRHPYSHWASTNYSSPIISNMKDARDIIEKGFQLIQRYYMDFK